MALTYF